MKILPLLLTLLLLTISPVLARSSSHSGSHAKSSTNRPKCASCARTSQGRIKRSTTAKRSFEKSNPCPATGKTSGPCPGYVVDHKQALKRGGADSPSNMQSQTKGAAKAKDRLEDRLNEGTSRRVPELI